MARHLFRVTAPDGTVLETSAPDHAEHTVAVIGLMRLRRPLPKVDPEDEKEEIRYDRFKAWVMIGSSRNEVTGKRLGEIQGYRNVTEETLIIPVTPVVTQAKEDEDEQAPLKVITETPAPEPVASAVDLDAL